MEMRIKYLLLTTLAAVALCRSCLGASIGTPSVTVEGPQVTLGDLRPAIKMDEKVMTGLSSVVIAASPLPGKSRLISRRQILQRLSRYDLGGVIQANCPEMIEVTRSSLVVSGEEIIAAGEELLREQNSEGEGEELVITAATPPHDVIVPAGEVELTARTIGSPSGRNVVGVTVSVLVEGRTVHRAVVKYHLEMMGEVLVASHNISRHSRLTSSDVKLERKDLFSIRGTPLRALEECEERRTTFMVAAGRPLTEACTEPIPLVLKGHEVLVTVTAPGVVVTASGVAREDGARGEMVRVQSAFSKEDFSAKVVGEGRVEIEMIPQRRAQ
jgi:flagella basal body P-ring formation protein FlgA